MHAQWISIACLLSCCKKLLICFVTTCVTCNEQSHSVQLQVSFRFKGSPVFKPKSRFISLKYIEKDYSTPGGNRERNFIGQWITINNMWIQLTPLIQNHFWTFGGGRGEGLFKAFWKVYWNSTMNGCDLLLRKLCHVGVNYEMRLSVWNSLELWWCHSKNWTKLISQMDLYSYVTNKSNHDENTVHHGASKTTKFKSKSWKSWYFWRFN